ncbi:AraC family transcriptional regulator [Mariniluteicoccus endophyticus]
MNGAIRPVHPALRGLLAGPMVAYDLLLDPRAVHLGVPSPTATMIVAFDEPLDVGWLAEGVTTRRWASLSGLHLRPALVRTHGVQRGIQLAVTPRGCRELFGLPAGAVAHDTVDLGDAPTGISDAEHAALAAIDGWAARLARLEDMLLRRLDATRPGVPADVAHAWRLLLGGDGVEDVARAVGWSRRHLGSRVRAELGVNPKQVVRLGRYARAQRFVAAGVPLADVAVRAGYSDQSHLSREFGELGGRPPSRAHDVFPILQDDGSLGR